MAVVVGHPRPEALEGEGAAPGVDVPVPGLGGRLEKEPGLSGIEVDVVAREAEDTGFVVLGHVLADSREVLDDGDVEPLQLRGGADARVLQDLGAVERPAGNNDFPRGPNRGQLAPVLRGPSRVCAVHGRAPQNFHAVRDRDGAALVEQDPGDEAVGLDRERVARGIVQGVADVAVGARACAVGVDVQAHAVESRLLVPVRGSRVDVPDDQLGNVVRVLVGGVGETMHDAEDVVRLLSPRVVPGVDAQPPVESMARGAAGEPLVPLNVDEVLAHAVGRPSLVAGTVDNNLPVGIRGQSRNGRVVHGAAPKRRAARVLYTESLSPGRRVNAGVEGPVGRAIGLSLVSVLELRVFRVLDKEVPAGQRAVHGGIVVGNRAPDGVVCTILAGLEKKSLVAGPGEVGGHGSSSRTAAYHNVVVDLLGRDGSSGQCHQSQCWVAPKHDEVV
ncbi:hypothetical protein CH063_04235 [Colletotrichum higginsianum]|uniref:Uncharacterized protein n=1 Tax=Colletotrichum higginsianum (strain IMI 349063) TaxID=759273 RepID=H1W597_COLHI|nr:hypothetical protein CH063_04235 [Colletotrichum higginsianum]